MVPVPVGSASKEKKVIYTSNISSASTQKKKIISTSNISEL
jgi:hypothetical protein